MRTRLHEKQWEEEKGGKGMIGEEEQVGGGGRLRNEMSRRRARHRPQVIPVVLTLLV